MGRYTGPACRLCRREGQKLFLKGERCFMSKCAIEQGRSIPGVHHSRRSKQSDYAVQLREKQRLRRMYGLTEGPFHRTFEKAVRRHGITGEILLQTLEMRLDNVTYRLGFAPSRRAARQFVRHGHIEVNGRRVTIPSAVLRAGDVVRVVDKKESRAVAAPFLEAAQARGISPWLILVANEFRGEVRHVPTRDEIAPIVNEQLIVELYSK